MKKNFFYAMMSAIALTGAVSFSACSSSDELTDVNPTYDGESVKTSFTISIGDVKSPTRMDAGAVEGTNPSSSAFQGMTNIYLFPFKCGTTGTPPAVNNISTTTVIDESYIHLGNISGFDSQVLTAKGKIYKDVSLSVGVDRFLFYGETNVPGNGKLKASYLSMNQPSGSNWATTTWGLTPINKGTSTVGDLTFDLVPINKGRDLDYMKTTAAATSTIAPLNAVDVALAAQIDAATTAGDADALTELKNLQKTLRNDISTTSDPTYKFYAGSSNSIKKLMEKLYNTLKSRAAAFTGSSTDYSTGIISAIETYFPTPSGDATAGYTLTWKTDPGDPNFPANLGLPDGAAAVQYVTSSTPNKFDFVTPSMEGLTTLAINQYTYPASLYYTVNTTSMVLDNEYLSTLTNQYTTWDLVKSNGHYVENPVAASTRSVIMSDQVQYAVGRLDVNVRVKESATILDNSKDAPQPVTVPGGGYTLTGVLIGGQKQVGYDFKPIGSTEMTIWDNDMTSTISAVQGTSFSGPNKTLALETAEDAAVNIALEFVNTGNEFCGIDHNLIPAGAKFYLVAKLDPTVASTIDANPKSLRQVFKQDFVTTANLVINETSLQKAYNVIPDLRSPKLEFGLSVNLEWQEGITFEQTFQ